MIETWRLVSCQTNAKSQSCCCCLCLVCCPIADGVCLCLDSAGGVKLHQLASGAPAPLRIQEHSKLLDVQCSLHPAPCHDL